MSTKLDERKPRPTNPQQPEPTPPFPKQHQDKPGLESQLQPAPRFHAEEYRAAGKLTGKIALITGGDSGIGRAVAVLFAREGADLVVAHLQSEASDAEETKRVVQSHGRKCVLVAGDVKDPSFCDELVESTVKTFGKLDILVSNAAHQNRKKSLD